MGRIYKTIEFGTGCTVEEAVRELLRHREKGFVVCGDFNGVTLYSDTVTMDSAYQEITGKTKAEFDKDRQQWKEDYDRRQKEHEENIPELSILWIEKGRKILSKDKWELWDEIVPIRLGDLYHGMELGNCLDIVEILNRNGSLDEAKEKIEKQGHSGMSFSLVCAMVKEFSDRGNEFVGYVK